MTPFYRILFFLLVSQTAVAQLQIRFEKIGILPKLEGHVRLFEKGSSREIYQSFTEIDTLLVVPHLKTAHYLLLIETDCCPLQTQNVDFPAQTTVTIALKATEIQLREVVIRKNPYFSKQGDTLIIHPEAAETHFVDAAEELFQSIPGLQKDELGRYTIFGKAVEKATVNGKALFSGNPNLILQNIRLDLIDKLEVVEPKSRINAQKVELNIRLKSTTETTVYGDISAGTNVEDGLLGGKATVLNDTFFSQVQGSLSNFNQGRQSNSALAFSEFMQSNYQTNAFRTLFTQEDNTFVPDSELAIESSSLYPTIGEKKQWNTYSSVNFTKPSFEIQAHYFLQNTQEKQQLTQNSSLLADENTFQKEETETSRTDRESHFFALDWKKNFPKKFFFRGIQSVKLQQDQYTSTSVASIIYTPTSQERMERTLTKTQQNENVNTFLNVYKLYKNPSLKTTFTFMQGAFARMSDAKNEQKIISLPQMFIQNYAFQRTEQQLQAEVTHALPLSKRISYEASLLGKYQAQRFQRTTENNPENWVVNQEKQWANAFVWLYRRTTAVASIYLLDQIRNISSKPVVSNRRTFVGLQHIYLTQKFSNQSNLRLQYRNTWKNPSLEQLLSLEDSTQLAELTAGNRHLSNFRVQSWDIYLSQPILSDYQISINGGRNYTDFEPIFFYTFNQFRLENTFINSSKKTFENRAQIQIQSNKKNTFFHFQGGFTWQGTQSFTVSNSEFTPIHFQQHVYHALVTLQPTKHLFFQTNYTITQFKNQLETPSRQQVWTTTLRYKRANKLDFQIESLSVGQVNWKEKPIVQTQVNMFPFQVKSIKIGLIATNLLNQMYIREITQLQNFLFTRQYNALPRTVILQCIYFWPASHATQKGIR